jgi:hypothetical protein
MLPESRTIFVRQPFRLKYPPPLSQGRRSHNRLCGLFNIASSVRYEATIHLLHGLHGRHFSGTIPLTVFQEEE